MIPGFDAPDFPPAPGEHVIDQVRRADQAKPDHQTRHGTSNRREAAAHLMKIKKLIG